MIFQSIFISYFWIQIDLVLYLIIIMNFVLCNQIFKL